MGADYSRIWGGPSAIVRRLLEDEDIADAVERNEVGSDVVGDGLSSSVVVYWKRRGTEDTVMKGIVYDIHRLRDARDGKSKREQSESDQCEKKEARRVAYQNRRADAAGCEADLTADEWRRIRDSFLNECAYCSSNRGLSMDHIVPLSSGGGTTRSNVVPCCKTCNSTKGPRSAAWLIGANAVNCIVERLESVDHD